MLTVGARLTPYDRTGLKVDSLTIDIDALAIALHLQLLQICWEAGKIGGVRHDADRLSAEEIVIPDGEQPKQQR